MMTTKLSNQEVCCSILTPLLGIGWVTITSMPILTFTALILVSWRSLIGVGCRLLKVVGSCKVQFLLISLVMSKVGVLSGTIISFLWLFLFLIILDKLLLWAGTLVDERMAVTGGWPVGVATVERLVRLVVVIVITTSVGLSAVTVVYLSVALTESPAVSLCKVYQMNLILTHVSSIPWVLCHLGKRVRNWLLSVFQEL